MKRLLHRNGETATRPTKIITPRRRCCIGCTDCCSFSCTQDERDESGGDALSCVYWVGMKGEDVMSFVVA